ncbi:MAG: hypothetical protein K6B44_06555, partial [Lachnospiraceae bacterium]|nr:hypothetical protein [Lachnospiraceae bacterium]
AAVATVSEYGNVKAVAEGEAVITAETVDGGKKATCTVKVTGEGATDPDSDPNPNPNPDNDDPAIDRPDPETVKPVVVSENKTEKINDADVTIETVVTYPKAVNWTGSKITKSQLAALSKDGVIAKVKISGLEQAIAGMNKDADLSKLVTISYIIGKEKKAGAEGSFTVKMKLNSKVLKKAKIKGKDKKALVNIIKELNKQFKANPYKFKILPVDISDTVNVESVTLKAKLKNGELQLNEDGSIKGLKSLKIKVKVPGLKKAKSYTFSGKKIAKSFTIKLTDAAAKKAEVTALAGQNFTGSRSGVEITK